MNTSLRLPSQLDQSNQTGEITATLLAASLTSPNSRLIVETDSQTTLDAVTRWKRQHEDTGYIGRKNALLTRATIARLRMRKAHTLLKWIKGHDGHPGNEAADRLAALGAAKSQGDPLSLLTPPPFQVSGAKLQALTQKLAYRAIRALEDAKTEPRPRAEANLDRISSGIEAAYGTKVKDSSIWSSFRARHVARKAGQFMWMATHDGYMLGTHWLRPKMSPELQLRAICKICGEREDMTHIIFECRACGQETIWSLLKTVWELTNYKWSDPSWGTTFGAACAIFRTANGARLSAAESLWTILCTEALHLVWKLRCERVIQNDGVEFSEQEITNRFYACMNGRLDLDRRTAAMAKGKKSLKPSDVSRIWLPILDNKDSLPPRWVVDYGVLVGIKRGR
ncbi:hypothetical protein K466DRAFT_612674 [Polyporus arcularius HHB13444]|uniref:ribonuclease H n=1 Tax=Polyporus arcularius HHB13444 TaxID=1314778 RepID=A0A5C3NMN6_9APHY|nr:hypothetical protein K466DRAFT_612674 [Polyporus arcularius HHB13444]